MRVITALLGIVGLVFLPYAAILLLCSPLFALQALTIDSTLNPKPLIIVLGLLMIINSLAGFYIWCGWWSFTIRGTYPSIFTKMINHRVFWLISSLQHLIWLPIFITTNSLGGIGFSYIETPYTYAWCILNIVLGLIIAVYPRKSKG